MKEILPEVEAWRESGEKVVVATVVATRRSAPRPVGTSLAVSESGKMCGSVSGGCVESDVYDNAMEVMRTGEPKLLHYGISDDLAWSVGLPLRRRDRRLRRGGRVTILQRLTELQDAGGRAVLFTVVEGDRDRRESARRRGRRDDRGRRARGGARPVRRACPPRAQPPRRGRRREGVRRVVRPAPAALRLRRGRHRRVALPGREAARLDSDRRGRPRHLPDARAHPLGRPADREVAGRGDRRGRPRPPDGDRRADPRRQVRRARADRRARHRGVLRRRARIPAEPGAPARTAPRGGCVGGGARASRAPAGSTSGRTPRPRPRSRSSRRSSPCAPDAPAGPLRDAKQRIHAEVP